MKRPFAFLISWLLVQRIFSASAQDTLPMLSLGGFLHNIQNEHPVARNADLLLLQAEAQVRQARGAFDPKLFADWQQKSFDGKNYFRIGEAGVKVSSQWGMEFKTSFNSANGSYLNPERQLPDPGQALLGLSIPLLNGLLFDDNRARLQSAQLGQQGLFAQRRGLLNDLLAQSGITYINWALAFRQLQITQQAYELSSQRFQGIRKSFLEGEKPAIDTIETFTQVQSWQLELNNASIAYRNASLNIQGLIWNNGQARLQADNWNWQPDSLPLLSPLPASPLDSLIPGLDLSHPDLLALQVDVRQLGVERRLALEQFKPRLDLNYNLLGRGFNFTPPFKQGENLSLTEALSTNYKWGLNFSFPIFLRKERGKMELVRIKQTQTSNKLDLKRIEVENKLRNYYNDFENSRRQIQVYQTLTNNLQNLLQAEQRRFELGESSIFLINSREQKLIETLLKYTKAQGEYAKNLLSVYWAAGLLPEVPWTNYAR